MALMERVATLVRANLNDLIDKAEDPVKMIKQIMLDMENQLLQVKTQVAIAIADQHLLVKKQKENEDLAADWVRKAELAVDKKQDALARVAIDRSMSYKQLGASFEQQVGDQTQQVETLKSALRKLEQKMEETRVKSDLLIARHRRSRSVSTAGVVSRIPLADARDSEAPMLVATSVDAQMAALEKEDEIEKLLAEIKTRKGLTA